VSTNSAQASNHPFVARLPYPTTAWPAEAPQNITFQILTNATAVDHLVDTGSKSYIICSRVIDHMQGRSGLQRWTCSSIPEATEKAAGSLEVHSAWIPKYYVP